MLNYVWFGLMLISVVVAIATDGINHFNGVTPEIDPETGEAVLSKIEAVTQGAITSAETAVTISIGLIGIMALWLGIMKIAEESQLIEVIAKIVRPITLKLFPDVPPDHPAISAIVLNMSANILGLGNAATPLGLKAMQELQQLNLSKDTATNAMCTFLAINTSSVQLILPASVVALMGVKSSEIFVTTIIATTLSTIAGIIAVKTLEKLPVFALETLGNNPDNLLPQDTTVNQEEDFND
jgi:spore maturation protein A